MNTLSTLLREKIIQENISEREASRQIGVSPTTVSRALSGELPDLTTMIAMCDWLGVSVSKILNSSLPGESALVARISAILEAKPELARVFVDAMTDIMERDAPPEVIRDIAAYAAFRLGLETTKLEDHKNAQYEVPGGGG